MTPHWLDIMPAIPLARGVPVVSTHGRREVRGPWLGQLGDEDLVSVEDWGNVQHANVPCVGARVDLDDPQGFAYALRWLYSNSPAVPRSPSSLRDRHLMGETTDADRLALAKACAEVAAAGRSFAAVALRRAEAAPWVDRVIPKGGLAFNRVPKTAELAEARATIAGEHQARVDEIARRFGLPPGGALTYRGLWDLDAGARRLNFGSAHPGRSSMPVPFLDHLNPHGDGADRVASAIILVWLDMRGAHLVAPAKEAPDGE